MRFNNLFNSKYAGRKLEQTLEDFKEFDSKMQQGYQYLSDGELDKAVGTWIGIWNEMMDYMEKHNIKTFEEFDGIYDGTQFVSNWVNDFEDCLNGIVAKSNDREVLNAYGSMRIYLNQQILQFVDKDDELSIENAKRAIAETHFYMGNIKKGDELFEKYLSDDPRWGWGWIGWSDFYWIFYGNKQNDYPKAEAILKKALAVEELRDREDVMERLMNFYDETDRADEAAAIKRELNKLVKSHQPVKTNMQVISAAKVGRNDPCPCGSGKKYKKCCGK